MVNDSEINALIQLLDDGDQEVFRHVHDRLVSFGLDVIPKLEEAWTADLNPVTHERIEELIHKIQFDSLVKEWKIWLTSNPSDLLQGAFLISQYYYPDADLDDVRKRMQKIKQSIWLELNYNQTPLEQIQIFNQVFYNHYAFKGSQASTDYQDYCINNVLENRKGNSISIGIIYQVLANELNLPVYGVNLIRHYILSFCKKMIFDFNSESNLEREIMFYINPINRGSIFSRNEIKDYLDKMKEEQLEEYFIPSNTQSIIREMLKYLIEISDQTNEPQAVEELRYLLSLV